MSGHTHRKRKVFIIATIAILLISPVFLLILRSIGLVSGEEFSPDDFSRRSFEYNKISALNWVIKKNIHYDNTPALEQTMLADGLIPTVNQQPKTWHLISDSGNDRAPECDAHILTDYLDLQGKDRPYWEIWNDEHPTSALLFWPVIADLAQHEMYLALPEIMRYAMTTKRDDSQKFQQALESVVSQSYIEFGRMDLESDRFQRAIDRLSRSIELSPTPKAYLLRAKARDGLGQTDTAQQDRTAANQSE